MQISMIMSSRPRYLFFALVCINISLVSFHNQQLTSYRLLKQLIVTVNPCLNVEFLPVIMKNISNVEFIRSKMKIQFENVISGQATVKASAPWPWLLPVALVSGFGGPLLWQPSAGQGEMVLVLRLMLCLSTCFGLIIC